MSFEGPSYVTPNNSKNCGKKVILNKEQYLSSYQITDRQNLIEIIADRCSNGVFTHLKSDGISALALNLIEQDPKNANNYRIVTAHIGHSPTYLIKKSGETVTAIRLTKTLTSPVTFDLPAVHIYDIDLDEFDEKTEFYILQTSDSLIETNREKNLTDSDYVANLFKNTQNSSTIDNAAAEMVATAYADSGQKDTTINFTPLKRNDKGGSLKISYLIEGNDKNKIDAANKKLLHLPKAFSPSAYSIGSGCPENLPPQTYEKITAKFSHHQKFKEQMDLYNEKLKELSNKLLNNKWNIVNIFGVRGYRVHSEDIKDKKGWFWKTPTNTLTTTAVKILDLIHAYFSYKAKTKDAQKNLTKLEATLIQIKFLLLSKNAENINSKYHSIYKEFFGKDSLLAQTLFNPAQEKISALFSVNVVNESNSESESDSNNSSNADTKKKGKQKSNDSEDDTEEDTPKVYTPVCLKLSKDGCHIKLKVKRKKSQDTPSLHPIIKKYFPGADKRLTSQLLTPRLIDSRQQLALAYQLQQCANRKSIKIKKKRKNYNVYSRYRVISSETLIKEIHTAQKTKYLSFTDFVVKMTEILARHPKSQITQEKREVFEHFIAFYNRNLGNPDMMPRSVMIEKWAQAYKNEFNQENPFEVLAKQRGFFKSGLNQTASMELFKQFMAGEEISKKLDTLMSPFEKETINLSGSLRSTSSSLSS